MFVLPFLLGILQILDSITTYKILSNGGIELNLLMEWLFKRIGMRKALIFKSIVVTIVGFLLYQLEPIILIPCCLMYALVVSWNTYQIYKA